MEVSPVKRRCDSLWVFRAVRLLLMFPSIPVSFFAFRVRLSLGA